MLGRAMLVLSIALLAFGSCSPGGSAGRDGRAHWLRIATGLGDPNSLNIHLDPSGTTGDVAELTQAYFVRYDRRAKPVPELITEIPTQANRGISPDGKTITWHLRRGVTWSDGVPFTGDDVVFTVNAINNPANNEEQGTAGWEEIASMDQPDAYTVRFHLKRPYGSYLPLYFGTAANEPCILPKHLLGSLPNINTAAYNAKPVGIGPFRITAWRRGDAIEMEANPNYWRGKPKLAGITFKLLPSQETLVTQMQTGEVDLWPLLPPSYAERLRGVAALTVRTEPNYRTTNLDFVYARVADLRVRQAVRAALDRPRMVRTVLHGYGSVHDGVVIPLDPPGEHDAIAAYDPAQARRLFDAAGWHLGADGIRVKNGERLVMHLVYQIGTAEIEQTVEAVRAMLKDVGVEVSSRKYAPNLFRAPANMGGILYSGKFEMAIYPRTLQAVSDVNGLYGCATIPPHGENATRYCNPTVDRLLVDVESSYDEALRRKLFAKVQQKIVADVPTIILYVWRGGYAYNRHVRNLQPPILTPFDDMMNVDVE